MKIGFIGTGNMGGAILRGYAASDASRGNTILIHNRTTEHNEEMAAAVSAADSGVKICNDNAELAEKAEIIIIGVKPDGVKGVLEEIAGEVNRTAKGITPEDKIVVSMAAGVSLSKMEADLSYAKAGCGAYAKLIRVMPNTPAQIGQAMTSISRNKNVSDVDMAKVMEIFNAVGRCIEVPEDLIDCVIGVSGSSTAYTYMYIQALVEAAVENGMDEETAREFAAQSVLGAALMVRESDESLTLLRDRVCSPNGTTIQAVNKLLENGFMDNVKEGFQAAVDRSKEMTRK
ncbi:MAG: pyrroline-5-carboxylate reductase [Clostridia bacterium]|nr:pyrroline-5-carboxylate reductase [Clostridia bacterium]